MNGGKKERVVISEIIVIGLQNIKFGASETLDPPFLGYCLYNIEVVRLRL